MNIRFTLALSLSLSLNSFSQQNRIDSLHALLRNSKEDTNQVNVLSELAWELCQLDRYDEALPYIQNGINLGEKLHHTRKLAVLYRRSGDYFRFHNNYPKAFQEYTKSLDIEILDNRKNGIIIVYDRIASLHKKTGNYQKSLEYYLRTLKLRMELQDTSKVASTYFSIGSLYEEAGNYQKSLEYYLRTLKLRIELQDTLAIADAYTSAGWGYQLTGNYKIARDFQLNSMKFYLAGGDSVNVANPFGNLGIIYKNLADYHNAIEYSTKALTLFKKNKDFEGVSEAHNNIGNVYRIIKEYNKALEHLQKGLAIAKNIQYTYEIKNSYEGLSAVYEALGYHEKALHCHKLFVQLRDSIINTEQQNKLTRYEMNYEFERKESAAKAEQEKKDAIATAEARRQKIVIWSAVSGLSLVILFAVFIFRSLHITRRQKQIIEIKNQETEAQKRIIEDQKEIVEEKNRNITDSITYAKRIQDAFLLSEDEMHKTLPYPSFVFFRPKDIVSGDFYWLSPAEDNGSIIYVAAAADCTGHGVPGAFLSMMGNMLLNEIVIEKRITDPASILNGLHHGIFNSLHRGNESNDSLDGMDIALCVIDPARKIIRYAGAMNPLYVVRQGIESEEAQLEIIKANILSLGGKVRMSNRITEVAFTNHEIPIVKGMRIYLFSDGYMDQFNTKQKLRFGSRQFQRLLLESAHLPIKQQKEKIAEAINDWIGSDKQVDDILVMGIEVS